MTVSHAVSTSRTDRTLRDLMEGHSTVTELPSRCRATAKSTGLQCGRAPIPGGTVCAIHGGNASQTRAKAIERRTEANIAATLERHSVAPVDNPAEALAALAGEVVALKDYLRERVTALRASEWHYETGTGEQLRAEVALYERALDRAGKLLSDMTRMGLDERLARISEAQGRTIRVTLDRIFDRLELTEAQRALLPSVVPEEFRRLAEHEGQLWTTQR